MAQDQIVGIITTPLAQLLKLSNYYFFNKKTSLSDKNMKTLLKLTLLFFAVFMVISKGYTQNNADPGIGILMSPSSVSQGSTGILSATVGNYGNGTIVKNSLRVTISVGPNAEILGIDSGSDVRWSQLNLTTGSANTILLTNTDGSFNPFDISDIVLTVRGNVVSAANGIAGNIVYITANNPLLCSGCSLPPQNASQGNASTSNDNSETSLNVTGSTLTVTNIQTNILCYGGSTGTSTATVTGGTPNYTYSWNTTPVQTSATATGLFAGIYVITVTDNTGSMAKDTIYITQPDLLVLSLTPTHVLCYGEATGIINASFTGGTPGVQYKLGNGAYQSSGTFSGLTAGVYTVTVKDANGCEKFKAGTITQSLQLGANPSTVDVTCFNGNGVDGKAKVTPYGGTPGYTYLWSNGKTTQEITGLIAGTYSVTVTDANGCSIPVTGIVVGKSAQLTGTATSNSPVCEGSTINLFANGGVNYSWNGPAGFSSGVQNPSIANGTTSKAGVYTVTLTDAKGCIAMATTSVTITDLPEIADIDESVCAGQTLTVTAPDYGAG